jgi:ubiquinone/menaquinone biosynthesis C-methylase UbiE
MTIKRTLQTQKRYDRRSGFYDLMEGAVERLIFRRLRKRLWEGVLSGRILEIGIGTGKNLPFHPGDARIVGVDLSPGMLAKGVAHARESAKQVDFVLADAQHLPFCDGVFDSAVATFVFCSVPDPICGLGEMGRVTRDNGGVHLLEHVRASGGVMGWVTDCLNPLAVLLSGANINRDTVSNVGGAGLCIEEVETASPGILKIIHALATDRSEGSSKEARYVAHG